MRKVAAGVTILLVLVVGGWTGAWFYAANQAGRQLDHWLNTEAADGRVWNCPKRQVGGYPSAITVSCTTPSFTARALKQTVAVELAGLTAAATLFDPHSLSLALRAPLTYRTSDGQADLTAGWSRLDVRLIGLPTIDAVALSGADIVVDGTFGDAGRQGGKAAQLDANFALDRQAAEPVSQFAIDVKSTPVPLLDALLGGEMPADIVLNGRLAKAGSAMGRTPAEAIEGWRQAGGSLALANSRIARGGSSVSGGGDLALDEMHRPQGRLDASFVGLDQVLKRYGISGNLAAAGNILGALFGGGSKNPQPQADPNALNLPITIQNGRIGVGPIRTQFTVPPIY